MICTSIEEAKSALAKLQEGGRRLSIRLRHDPGDSASVPEGGRLWIFDRALSQWVEKLN